jgi:hypothetical protein
MQGRLNIFQKSMLQWNDLHPYNAVHVVRIPDASDIERLQRVIVATLEKKGLTGLELNRSAGTFRYHGGAASPEIRILPADVALSPGLAGEIERQLNTPFAPDGRFSPFRFFVVPDAGALTLGLVYFHPMADAECVLFLLQDMVEAYLGRLETGAMDPMDRHPPRRDQLRCLPAGVLARRLAALPGFIRHLRKASRPHYRDPACSTNRFVLFTLAPPMLAGMAQAARSWGVTLNDFFLALLMKAVSLIVPEARRAARRNEIALGCIVNARKDLAMDGRRAFGLFLGSFVVHHRAPAGIGLADLARDVARQTVRIKRNRLYLGATLELAFGRRMASWFPVEQRGKLYPKHYPLWGGLTNMDLTRLWPQPDQAPPVDYLRAVSTGPVTPLVLSITTLGQVVKVGLTYRATVFSTPEIECIQDCFRNAVSLAAGHP